MFSLLSAPSNFSIAPAECVSRTFVCTRRRDIVFVLTFTLSASRVNLIQESRRFRQNNLCHQSLPHGIQIVPFPYHFHIVHVHGTKEYQLPMTRKNITVWFLSPIRFLTGPSRTVSPTTTQQEGVRKNSFQEECLARFWHMCRGNRIQISGHPDFGSKQGLERSPF